MPVPGRDKDPAKFLPLPDCSFRPVEGTPAVHWFWYCTFDVAKLQNPRNTRSRMVLGADFSYKSSQQTKGGREKAMIISQIDSHLAQLRPSEQRVARFVLGRPTVVVEMSIADLAERADVSEPTIMRFCKAIGCMGFMDFKLSLARDLERRTLSMSRLNPHVKGHSGLGQALFEQVAKTLAQKVTGLALDEIETLLEICAGSGRIIVLHSGAETLFADTLVRALRGCGLEVCDQTTADFSGRRDSILVIALKSSVRIAQVEQSLQEICAQGGRVALIGHAGLPATLSLGQFDASLADYIAYASVVEAIALGVAARLSKSGHFSQADSEMLQSQRENAYADARRRDRQSAHKPSTDAAIFCEDAR